MFFHKPEAANCATFVRYRLRSCV